MLVNTNGITLEVKEYGPADGPALVLIRGLGSQLIHWPDELVLGFANAGYRTIIFDNRDVGLSARCPDPNVPDSKADILAAIEIGDTPAPAYTLNDMALDVTGLLDTLGINKAHVFGISMGGAITQILAAEHAGRLLSAMIVMTATALRDPSLLDRLLVEDLSRAAFQDNWVAGHQQFGSPGYPMPEADIRAEAGLAWDRGADAAGVNRQVLATIAAPDRSEALKSISLPCLVIHGVEDTLVPVAAGRKIAALIPNAELKVFDGMGHIITPLLAPGIVNLVDNFITRQIP